MPDVGELLGKVADDGAAVEGSALETRHGGVVFAMDFFGRSMGEIGSR